MTSSNDRLDRIEQTLERLTQLLERIAQNQGQFAQTQGQIIQIQERQQEQIQVLVAAARNHEARIARTDALIERLDAIIERLVYREGRSGGESPQSSS